MGEAALVGNLEIGSKTGRVIAMNEPQVWTLIGVLAASLFAVMTLMSTMFVRIVQTEIRGVRTEIRGEVGGLRAEMNARFEAVDVRLEHLDRDVQAIVKKVFREEA